MRPDKITLLIPIGKFSYFVNACLQNAFETSGENEAIDFVFLTSKNMGPDLELAFQKSKFKFRIISAPFDSSNHLELLDWAVRNADITNWFVTQHCDMFWKSHSWLNRLLDNIDDKLTVICLPYQSSFYFQGENIPVVGDFFGCYNKQHLLEQNLFFKWGKLGSEVNFSRTVNQAIENGLICHKDRKLKSDEFIDGSQAIAWELFVNNRNSIKMVRLAEFNHLTGFFRIAETVYRTKNIIYCPFVLDLSSYVMYSFLTSFCIERSEVEKVALPWIICDKLAAINNKNINNEKQIGSWLQNYSTAKETVNLDDLGLTKICLAGKQFSVQDIKFL